MGMLWRGVLRARGHPRDPLNNPALARARDYNIYQDQINQRNQPKTGGRPGTREREGGTSHPLRHTQRAGGKDAGREQGTYLPPTRGGEHGTRERGGTRAPTTY